MFIVSPTLNISNAGGFLCLLVNILFQRLSYHTYNEYFGSFVPTIAATTGPVDRNPCEEVVEYVQTTLLVPVCAPSFRYKGITEFVKRFVLHVFNKYKAA